MSATCWWTRGSLLRNGPAQNFVPKVGFESWIMKPFTENVCEWEKLSWVKCYEQSNAYWKVRPWVFLKINFYPHTLTSHPLAATGITVRCTQKPVRPFDPWHHLRYPSAREWGQDTYQSGFLLNPPVITEKESLKIKPCSFLCAWVFCLIDNIRKPGEKVVKSRQQGKPTLTENTKLFKGYFAQQLWDFLPGG